MNKILNRVFCLLKTMTNWYFTLDILCIFVFCTLLKFRITAYKCILLMKNFTATYLKSSFTFWNDFSIIPQRTEMIYWEFLNKFCNDHNWQQTFWRRVTHKSLGRSQFLKWEPWEPFRQRNWLSRLNSDSRLSRYAIRNSCSEDTKPVLTQ